MTQFQISLMEFKIFDDLFKNTLSEGMSDHEFDLI